MGFVASSLLMALPALLLTADAQALTLRRSVFAGSGWAADRTTTAFAVAGEAITGVSRAGSRVLWHGFVAPAALASSAVATGKPPAGPWLDAPAPNPCSTRVALRVRGDTAPTTTLDVYDVRGRLVRRLSTGASAAAQHDTRDLVWALDDAAGRRVAAGLYFVRPAWPGAGRARAVLVVP